MRRSNWLGFVTVLAGGVIAAASLAVGCGGKTDEPGETPADTGVGIVESGPDTSATKDTGTGVVDSDKTWDVPGSLYDAEIPDVVFDGGTTAAGCVACTTRECKTEVDACDSDPKCRGVVLCVITECGGSATDYGCLLGCAAKYDVSYTDPVALTAVSVAQCVQKKCTADCPIPAGDGGAPKSDSSADAPETSAYMIFPETNKSFRSIDPRLVEALQSIAGANAEVRAGLVERFSH